jgi:signal transduction histidine kinase/CheY-like chemotaxis protein
MSPELKARRLTRRRALAAAFGVVVLCAWACVSAPVRADIPTYGVTKASTIAIGPRAEVLAVPDARPEPTRMLSPETRFDPPLGKNPGFGIDETPRWYRFALRNDSGEHLHVYLDVGYPGLDRISLHHVARGELVSETAGNSFPFDQRPIRFPTFLFRTVLDPGETRTFALEVESTSVHSVSIEASGEHAFIDRTRRGFLWNGIFFGILFMLTLRHALAYLTTSSREELWYVAQSFGAGLYVASLMGALYGRWPDAVAFNTVAPLYFIGLAIFSTARFGVAYLALGGITRRVIDALSLAVLLGVILAGFLSFGAVVAVYFTAMVLVGSVLLVTAFRRAREGSRPAGLYLLAWAPVFAVSWAFGLSVIGLVPAFHLGAYMIGGALVWERVVVSAGLQLRVSESVRSELRLREEALVAAEERRKLEIERQRGRRLESLGRLSGGIAHDFNNLLQAIGGYIHIVSRQEKLTEKGAAHLDQAKRSVQRAANLTQKLLVLGRTTSTESARVVVDQSMRELEELLQRVLPSDIELALDLNAGDAAVACDRAEFELCITNLCLNARDAMPRGGALSIATAAGDDRVTIHVEDTGEGIAKEHRDRIFEPFFTTKTIGEGTGLGLVMVHGIVTSAGGNLRVESEVGAGSRFELEMPVTSSGAAEEPAAPTPSAARGGSERILLVDDAEGVREVGVAFLKEAGYEVSGATDGVEAIEILERSRPFDLVVMDVVMPRMGGAELYEWLKKNFPEIPVLVCTAYRPEDAATRLDRAQLPILRKPYEAEELLHAVRSLLDLKREDAPAPRGPHRA